MNCPCCSNLLIQTKVGDASFHKCSDSCLGIWIERKEVQKLKTPSNEQIDFLNSLICNAEIPQNLNKQRFCPKCKDRPLSSRVHKQIELDQCDLCWGTWFDCGEILVVLEKEENKEKFREKSNAKKDKELAIAFSQTLSSYAKKIEEQIKEEEEKIKRNNLAGYQNHFPFKNK